MRMLTKRRDPVVVDNTGLLRFARNDEQQQSEETIHVPGQARRSGFPSRRRAQAVRLPHRGLRRADAGCRRGAAAHDLAVARSLYARAHERRAVLCAAGAGRRRDGGRHGQRGAASNNPAFAKGDIVLSRAGWQTHALSSGKGLAKIDPKIAPISTAVGVLGMPGMTAYTGLLDIGKPQAGETVVVAAASGAVGSAVGQIAKIKGARAVGIAGGKDKCDYVKKRARLRRLPRSSRSQSGRQAEGSLPEGHRRLFRECRRRGVRGGVSAAQRVRAHAGVRPDRALQRHRGGRAEMGGRR